MARIRTVKPEFFTSQTIAGLTYRARLLFIGLWTHCDDEGRCEDDPTLIRAALFIREPEVTDSDIEADLRELAVAGLITRYTATVRAAERPVIQVNAWAEHQRVNRGTASRIPAPSLSTHGGLTEDSLSTHAVSPLGTRNRGTGEQGNEERFVTADAATPDAFDEFWSIYPRKVGKRAARIAWDRIADAIPHEVVIAGARRYAADPNREDAFTAHPTTWLNQGRWDDDPLPPRIGTTPTTDPLATARAWAASEESA